MYPLLSKLSGIALQNPETKQIWIIYLSFYKSAIQVLYKLKNCIVRNIYT